MQFWIWKIDIQHRFIQLTKFKKKRHELVSLVDKWTFFIKHAGKLDVIPEDVLDEGLKTAYQEADKHTWKKEELIAYENASIREQDDKGEREFAKEEGKKEMILEMYAEEMTIKQIAKIAKKTEEEISAIIEKHRNKK